MSNNDDYEIYPDLDVKTIDELTETDWAEIAFISDKIWASKLQGNSRTRCAVHAFIKWMSCKDFVVGCTQPETVCH